MSKTQNIPGVLAGTIIYLVIVSLGLTATTFYTPPEALTPVMLWLFLGLAPLVIASGCYIFDRTKKVDGKKAIRELKLGFCGYVFWLAVLMLMSLKPAFKIDEHDSILVGYAIVLAMVVLGRKKNPGSKVK